MISETMSSCHPTISSLHFTMKTMLLGFEPNTLSASALDQIQALVPDMRLLVTTNAQEIEAALGEIEIAVKQFPQALMPQAPHLRWFQQWGAGADWLLHHPAVAASDLVITTGSGVHAIPISEHILAYLFAFARALPKAIRSQTQYVWQQPEWGHLFELAGKTMVLIGVGAIGERTALMAHALGIRVLGVRHNADVNTPGVEAMFAPAALLDLLPQADFVVITVPLTEATRGLIGAAELQAMKASAYLVNIGRGAVIDEVALVRALQAGKLAGAGLDVFASEPLPPDSPLWAMENVIITGHYAGATPIYEQRAMTIFLDNLRRYRAGEPLRNVVDKASGY